MSSCYKTPKQKGFLFPLFFLIHSFKNLSLEEDVAGFNDRSGECNLLGGKTFEWKVIGLSVLKQPLSGSHSWLLLLLFCIWETDLTLLLIFYQLHQRKTVKY